MNYVRILRIVRIVWVHAVKTKTNSCCLRTIARSTRTHPASPPRGTCSTDGGRTTTRCAGRQGGCSSTTWRRRRRFRCCCLARVILTHRVRGHGGSVCVVNIFSTQQQCTTDYEVEVWFTAKYYAKYFAPGMQQSVYTQLHDNIMVYSTYFVLWMDTMQQQCATTYDSLRSTTRTQSTCLQ